MTQGELDFLRESNNIEDEYSDLALQDAILAWEYLKKQDTLTAEVVKQTHKILMAHRETLGEENKGHWRRAAVWIGQQEAKPWVAIPALMDQWIVSVNDVVKDSGNKPPALLEDLIKEQHIQFEVCHPWQDGNGRSGRLFLNWQRIKCGLTILIIHTGEEQFAYYKWFPN